MSDVDSVCSSVPLVSDSEDEVEIIGPLRNAGPIDVLQADGEATVYVQATQMMSFKHWLS